MGYTFFDTTMSFVGPNNLIIEGQVTDNLKVQCLL